MKANQAARSRDDAVSTVLGGILVFSLVVMFLVVVRTQFAPVWTEDDEAKHMSTVQGQFAALRAESDRQTSNSTSGAVGLPITLLERQTSRFFTPANLPGTVTFEPGAADVSLAAPEILLFEQNGEDLAGVDETWNAANGAVTDVQSVRHLRLRIADPGGASDGDQVVLTVTNAAGPVAELASTIHVHTGGYTVRTTVRSDTGAILYDQGPSYFDGDAPAFHWVDALAPELHFRGLLAAADGPFTLSFTQTGVSAQYSLSHTDSSGVLSGGSGRLLTGWSAAYQGGSLRFESQSLRFPQQEWILENGAVRIEQNDGSVMRIDPRFTLSVSGTSTRISMMIPSLTGDANSVGGGGTATVTLDGSRADHLLGTVPQWSVTVESSDPAAWADIWNRALTTAGLSAGAGHFTITTGATTASLLLSGLDSGPAHDITIEVHHAVVDVELQS